MEMFEAWVSSTDRSDVPLPRAWMRVMVIGCFLFAFCNVVLQGLALQDLAHATGDRPRPPGLRDEPSP
jgi:hypothetical protein